MENAIHTFQDLFKQLGLPYGHKDIASFIKLHKGISEEVPIPDAPFWTESQKEFLRQQIEYDADWAELIDELSLRLR